MITDISCKILGEAGRVGSVRQSAESAAVCIFIGVERVTLWGIAAVAKCVGRREKWSEGGERQSGRVGMRGTM